MPQTKAQSQDSDRKAEKTLINQILIRHCKETTILKCIGMCS